MPRFKSTIFYYNNPKINLFLQKMQNYRALGAPRPDPHASGDWGLRSQTPIGLRRLGVPPPAPKTVPHCEFLATRLPEKLR